LNAAKSGKFFPDLASLVPGYTLNFTIVLDMFYATC
jgi:hypothetical protein